MRNPFILLLCAITTLSSCTIIRPGQDGVKQKLGRLSEEVHTSGSIVYNPFESKVIKPSLQTNNLELTLNLPSKEELSINSPISILYKLSPERAPFVIKNFGVSFEPIIANIFRSASADVCSKYFAKDLHTGMRAEIEKSIINKMMEKRVDQGIQIDAVLMKSIQLPEGLSSPIEQKLQAEQDEMRMEFTLKQAKFEADRKITEAQGTCDAPNIISEGLTEEIIKIRSIEAFLELIKSPYSKIIISDGKIITQKEKR